MSGELTKHGGTTVTWPTALNMLKQSFKALIINILYLVTHLILIINVNEAYHSFRHIGRKKKEKQTKHFLSMGLLPYYILQSTWHMPSLNQLSPLI